MAATPVRPGLLLLALTLAGYGSARAQAAASWSNCKTDGLSNYNCASYYSGTVSLSSELKSPSGTETRSVVATVTGGRVVCRVKGPTGAPFEGPGMLAAEHSSTGNAGQYSIKVWCPETEGTRPTRDDAPTIDTYEQQSTNYAVLEGKDAHEHPDADAANNVTGTETITWALHR